ncbi:MAG: DUF1343 domain-containing protein [Planctomycetaceae bacterium]|nr:DUF1343 domain-containing protein [Planctomycetaceae bacterium]
MRLFKYITIVLLAGISGCVPVRTGLDNVNSYQHIFQGKRIGIIANHTACDSNGRFITDVFRQMPGVKVTALFGPEHGFAGTAADGKKIEDSLADGNIPVYSLYGENNKPTAEMLENVDVLVFDIQDIGSRYYTYISTMALSMESAAANGKTFVVLDRPNPINAVNVQGDVLDINFSTFVGLYPIATRHAMTAGELAKMFNGEHWLKDNAQAKLIVIPMTHCRRSYWYDQTGLKFINPSPNMTSVDAAAVYTGTCLIEGTNISEGRGTDNPFLVFGAPWIDAQKLTAELNKINLPGLKFVPKELTPTASKFKDEKCFGCEIIITNRNKMDSFYTGVAIVDTIARMYPENFEWKIKHFDRLCGTDIIRKAIEKRQPVAELRKQWRKEISEFNKIRKRYLIYK